jgi:hypothetical protein
MNFDAIFLAQTSRHPLNEPASQEDIKLTCAGGETEGQGSRGEGGGGRDASNQNAETEHVQDGDANSELCFLYLVTGFSYSFPLPP